MSNLNTFFLRAWSGSVGAALVSLACFNQAAAQTNNIAINADGSAPATQAILDVKSTTKGVLIPRVATTATVGAPGSLPQGLTVYQTSAPAGFYTVEYGKWIPFAYGNNVWDILGNSIASAVNPITEFVGTTDNKDLVFKTDNTERMRLSTGSGFLGVGYVPYVTPPVERLDINGALRIYQPTGSPSFSATSAPGVMRYQTTPEASTATVPNGGVADGNWPVMPKGHWGNITGTGSVAGASINPNPGGWRRFENDYDEEVNKPYAHFGLATCVPNSDAEVPSGPAPAQYMSTANLVSTFAFTTGLLRVRKQYLYLRNELNLEVAQSLGATGTTQGLCPGEPITSFAFYVDPTTTGHQSTAPAYWIASIKHVPALQTNMSGGFDNSIDPAAGCGRSTGIRPASLTPHWEVFTLATPFVWDGARNIIVEVAAQFTATVGSTPAVVPMRVTSAVNMTYSAMGAPSLACNVAAPMSGIASCALNVNPTHDQAAGLTSACNGALSPERPVIRFHGGVTTAGPATSGTGSYLNMPSLIVENTMTPFPWGRWRPGSPATNNQFTFKGVGTISAEFGVYDDGVGLNDHVLDRAFDGQVAAQDAASFGHQRNFGISEMGDFTKRNRHLPTMKGRSNWNAEGGFSLGDVTNQLWATTETQALYVTELHDKLNALEILSDDRPLNAAEFAVAKANVCAMASITESEKAALLRSLELRTVTTNPR